MNKIKIMVHGCNGAMGQEVIKVINQTDEIEIFCGFDKCEQKLDEFVIYNNYSAIQGKPDVIVDFSIPQASLNALEYAKNNNIPIVIATTGFNSEQLQVIQEYSNIIPIFKSNNMSVEINLMCKIVNDIAKVLNNSDIEILEIHHNRKIDSPSGTALMLAESINKARNGQMNYELDRHNRRQKRNKNDIGISSIRGGNIVGEHSVMFFGENESFEVKHTAYSRTVFAEGAIRAAKFLVNKNNGLFDMNDLLQN